MKKVPMATSSKPPRATPMPMPALAPVLRLEVEEVVEDAEADVPVVEPVAEGRRSWRLFAPLVRPWRR